MYCNRCGNPVHAGDVFCSKCGSRLSVFETEKATGEVLEEKEPYKLDTSEFVWDVPEFASRAKQPESVTVDWASGTMQSAQEPVSVQMTEPEPESMPEPENVPEPDPEPIPEIKGLDEIKTVDLSDIEEDIAGENKDRMRDTAKLEKFYTFSQKNEEFQKLLDREYERIKSGRGEEEAQTAFDPVAHLKEAEEARNAVSGHPEGVAIMANDEIIRKFDTMELEKDLIESVPDSEEPGAKKERGFQSIILDELFGPKTSQEETCENEPEPPVVPAFLPEESGEEEPEPPKRKGIVGKIIITLMVILLVCELAALGITRFMPESKAADVINNKLTEITEMIH